LPHIKQMNKIISMIRRISQFHILSLIVLFFVASCSNQSSDYSSPKASLSTNLDSVSYAIGYQNGKSIAGIGAYEVSEEDYLAGLKAGLSEEESLIGDQASQQLVQKFVTDSRSALLEANKKKSEEFLADNLAKEGIMETESGLQYKVIEEGTGESPTAESEVTVHYEGTLIDGTVFDSSYERGEPATFKLNGVIEGWTEGLQLMKEGATYMFYIPSELAYGTNPRPGGAIQPNDALIFKVELLEVK